MSRKAHYDELKTFKFEDKVLHSKNKIKEFLLELDRRHQCDIDNKDKKLEVLLSFSGGKDSTVLFHLVVETFSEIKEQLKSKILIVPGYAYEITFPQTHQFIKDYVEEIRQKHDFVTELLFCKPKLPWLEILSQKGYPIFSKQQSVLLNRIKRVKSKNGLTRWIFKINTSRYGLAKERLFLLDDKMRKWNYNADYLGIKGNDYKKFLDYFGKDTLDNDEYIYSEKCCNYIKNGLKNDKRPSFIGTMASESQLRKQSWIKYGCNILNGKKMVCRPLSIWTELDIWKYIIKNKPNINKMYGFNRNTNATISDNAIKNEIIPNLQYKRLGCTACPYGAHMEAKNNTKNRFETLWENSRLLYKSQVIDNMMYKVLIDMDIKIPSDERYMKLYDARHKQRKEWLDNIDKNIFDVISQIENYKNYKNYKSIANKDVSWTYDDGEIIQILNNYGVVDKNGKKFTKKEVKKRIRKYREKRIEKQNGGQKCLDKNKI